MKKENKKQKINPIVKEQKELKKIKVNNSNIDDDTNIIKKLVVIVVVIAVLIGIVYVVTELVTKDAEEETTITEGEINYDKTSVGMILNRPYDEYYVMVYNAEDADAVLYSTILTKYMNEEDSTKIYFCDLNNKLNSSYYNVDKDNKSNPDAKSVEDFDFGDLTLIKVKKGKIVKYVEDLDTIRKILK